MSEIEKRSNVKSRSSWWWVPSLYYAEGIPYIIAMAASVAMYKMLGVRNSVFTFWTAALYLPWVLKPIWSPIIEMFSKKRNWIYIMQFFIGLLFLGIAFTIQLPLFFTITIVIFWFMAFFSATHDIAADGFYMLGQSEKKQAFFVGIRCTFYRLAMMTGQGLLLILVGVIETNTGLPSIDIKTVATPDKEIVQTINVEDIDVTVREGDLRIVCTPEILEISTKPAKLGTSAAAIAKAEEWNIQNGHILKDEVKSQKENAAIEERKFEKFIRNKFGEKKILKKQSNEGNVGYLYFHLSKKPEGDEEIIVNFGRESGDKSISLKHGERFIFNADNWNIPAIVVIQLDPNLKIESATMFLAKSGKTSLAWSTVFIALGILFLLFAIYHRFMLPHPETDRPMERKEGESYLFEFLRTFKLFFQKKNIGIYVAFLLLYRLSESQLVKLAQPFLLDSQETGGLALTAGQVGFAYGTVGVIMLIIGGLIGGFIISKYGLKKWLWWMALAINIPNAVYIFMAFTQPDSLFVINICVGIEQLGYGFGFTAYMLFMIYVAEGEYKTAHFAITTAFMALGMMIPGMWSGWLQELIGYRHFFVWVVICVIPIFVLLPFVPLDPTFGVKDKKEK
ncbi:MFS transporter [bacterium]|nr:MFS transporter [bacterium]